jgi:hypothetical protein
VQTDQPISLSPTAGVTGKGGNWLEKPPDAESAVGTRIPNGVVQKVEKEVVGGYPRGDLRFFVKPSSRKENLNTIGA